MSINRFAAYALNWLDAKTRGRLPPDWEERIRWAASADPFYDAETVGPVVLTGGGILSVGIVAAGQLPQDAVFIPHLVHIGYVIGTAAATFTGRPIVSLPGFSTICPVGRAFTTPAALPNGYTDGFNWEPPRLVLPPNTTFGWEVTASAGTVLANAYLYGVRIPLR